ncbi:hypothetical protein N9M10_00050 [Hellea sp.]|nr:hypothetical protein [Hellea sp.]
MKIPELDALVTWFEDNVLNSQTPISFDESGAIDDAKAEALTQQQEELMMLQFIIGIDDIE